MTRKRFNELKKLGYFRDDEKYSDCKDRFKEEIIDSEVYVIDLFTYKGSQVPRATRPL